MTNPSPDTTSSTTTATSTLPADAPSADATSSDPADHLPFEHDSLLTGNPPHEPSSPGHNWLRRAAPGLVVVVLLGLAAFWLSQNALPQLGEVTIAILLGVLAGNLLPDMQLYTPGVLAAEKRLLPVAIALLGVELQLATLVQLGPVAALIIAATITTSIVVSLQLARLFGYSRNFALLMGAGNGVCGSSAVAATGIAIGAREEETGISISIVNLLGTIGIFVVPALASLLALPQTESGIMVGSTLQAVGQVVAAGFSVGDGAGSVAIVVKMGRVLMLGPVVILIAAYIRRGISTEVKAPIQVPRFIIGFFILSVLASLSILPADWIAPIRLAGKLLLIVAMAGIGMRIQIRTLFRSGPAALLYGALIWLAQIVVVTVLLLAIAAIG